MSMEIKHFRPPLLVFGLVILAATLLIMVKQTFRREVPSVEQAVQTVVGAEFKLSSPAFDNGTAIPTVYTCTGANINPPLNIENIPGNAKEFVVIMHDPDASSGDLVHWVAWNIPVNNSAILEHSIPDGAKQGTSDFGNIGYSGPCPPAGSGTHHYIFELYALNDTLNLDTSTKRAGVISAMNGKVIAKTQLTGTVSASAKP
jgi:Raf kinase inhibitor-like YbhB/YbcL family protein